MRIVFIHTDFMLYWPKRLFYLKRFLENLGHYLTVIDFSEKGTNYYFAEGHNYLQEIEWYCLFPEHELENIKTSTLQEALYRKLDEIQPDVIFSGAIAFPSGALASAYGILKKIPIIIFDNARLEDVPRSWFVNYIKKLIYSNVDAIFCPASSLIPTYKYFGFKSEQLFYGLNVVDNHFFALKSAANQSKNEPDPFNLPDRFFLGVGRQVDKKNWRFLIDCYNTFQKRYPENPYHLVLVGDGPERPSLEKQATGKVHFFPFTDRTTLCYFYSRASALILPSYHGETWGLVVNEAMASSLPVFVSSHCGCASTLVEENVNGYTFDPRNSEQLVLQLVDFSNKTDADRELMGQYSFRIISNWSLNHFCNGAWDAILYVVPRTKRIGNRLSRFIVRNWKGRYHST
jgi:glycosyltransferase involved in cell wall biosynthesis